MAETGPGGRWCTERCQAEREPAEKGERGSVSRTPFSLLGSEIPGTYPNIRASGVIRAGMGPTPSVELGPEGRWLGLASCREAQGAARPSGFGISPMGFHRPFLGLQWAVWSCRPDPRLTQAVSAACLPGASLGLNSRGGDSGTLVLNPILGSLESGKPVLCLETVVKTGVGPPGGMLWGGLESFVRVT